MKRTLVVVAVTMLVCGGCASVPKTMTYQTTEWREVEEPQPAKVVAVQAPAPVEAIEIVEVAQPPKTIVVQAGIPRVFPGAKKGRKYLHIGYKPVNPNRALTGDEKEFILPADAYVETPDRDEKVSKGWLLSAERVVGLPTNDPNYYKAIWIRRCGNPILNDGSVAILIRVRRDIIPQLPVRTPQLKVKASQVPVRMETVPQPPVKQWVPVTVERTRELTCQERKAEVTWWRKGLSYVVTGAVGAGGALIGAKVGGVHGVQIGAGIGVLAGRLVGGYTDGSECINAGDVAEGVILGVTAGLIAPSNAPNVASGSIAPSHQLPGNGGGHTIPSNGGGHTLPSNGGGGHTLPSNGTGGYAPSVNPISGHSLPLN